MRDIIADPTRSIVLGRPGENEATLVKFPIAHWVEQFGNTGMFTLVHKRFEDEDVYPCVVKWDSTAEYVSWVIKEYDVLKVGTGTAVLSYTINNQIVKSKTFDTIVLDTVVVPSEAPDPYKDWVENVTNTVGEMWEKMNTVESGAQVNVIEKITDNGGTELTVEEKTVKLPDFALSTDLANKIDRPKTAFNKQVLTYNAEKSIWEADDPQGGGESSTKIKQLFDVVYDDEGNPADFVFKYTPQELFPDVNWETGAGVYEAVMNQVYLFVPLESTNAPFAYLTAIEPDFENPENGTVSGIVYCNEESEIQTYTFGPIKKGESVQETLEGNWAISIPDDTEIDFSSNLYDGSVLTYFSSNKEWRAVSPTYEVVELVNYTTNTYAYDGINVYNYFNRTDKTLQKILKFNHYPVINVTNESNKYYAYYINSTGLYKVELMYSTVTIQDSELIYEFKNVDLSNYYTKAETDEKIATIDLSLYAKTADVDEKLAKKQDVLTAGNNVSITGNTVSVDLSAYAKTTDLSAYAKTSDLGVYATQTYVQDEIQAAVYDVMEASY